MQRISGKDVEVRLSTGVRIVFEQVNVNVDDSSAATSDQGDPHGWAEGEMKAEGDIEISTETLLLLNEEAAQAGSWRQLPEFDMTLYANVASVEFEIKLHGVKLKAYSFSLDGKGGDKLTHTIPFMVTSPDFIHLNGVPLTQPR